MRKEPLVTGEYYHVYNRGVDKRNIFSNKKDIERFLESMLEFNRIEVITSLANARKTPQIAPKALSGDPIVSIVAYCLNPNHFHFILKQLKKGGIAKFMQKLQGGYTSYFNIKNSRTGSLLQGTFKSHLIKDENYFRKTFGYVNNNYEIHNISKTKMHLVRASNYEYKENNFKLVSRKEALRMLEIFNGTKNLLQHCKEIASIIREERRRISHQIAPKALSGGIELLEHLQCCRDLGQIDLKFSNHPYRK